MTKTISEQKILEFIKEKDNRNKSVLSQYESLITRLIKEGISKSDIYKFIKSENNEVGTLINFYKYVSRNIKPKQEIKQEPKQEIKQEPKQEIKVKKSSGSRAVDILMQDFDLGY